MEIIIKEIGLIIKNKEQENIHIIVLMNIMMELGIKEINMVKEKQNMHMENYIKEILLII